MPLIFQLILDNFANQFVNLVWNEVFGYTG